MRLARAIMRRWLPLKERKRKQALETAFTVIREQALKSKDRPFPAASTLFNIALYLLVAERDIQSLKIDALTHPDAWKRKLCARVILLTIHELDFDKVSGAPLRSALDEIGASESLRRDVTNALREVRVAQQKARKAFNPIRNTTIAHRDSDAIAQCNAIDRLDVDEVFAIVADFYKGVGHFTDVLPKIMTEGATLPSLLRQWLRANAKNDSQLQNN
jgi:hypothetical protein